MQAAVCRTPAVDVARRRHCRVSTRAARRATRASATQADSPSVEEIIAVMHAAGDDSDAVRLGGLIVVLWRAGLRISEAPALTESDLDLHRGAILVRRGNGGKRREVGMARSAWEQLRTRWHSAPAALRATSATRPPRNQPGRSAPANTVHTRSLGRTAISPAYPTRRPRDHLGLPSGNRQHRERARCPRPPGTDDPGHPRPVDPASTRQRGRPRNASSASQVGACARGPIRIRRPSPSRLTAAASPSFSSRDCWTWARSKPVSPW